jgi:hypothetical protein
LRLAYSTRSPVSHRILILVLTEFVSKRNT